MFVKLNMNIPYFSSERVYKTSTTGLALSEAKFINLSLHYLQQVILALAEQKRTHIPYRNSMMTNILKDSLCGNCLTVMIANLAITRKNIPVSNSYNFSKQKTLTTISWSILSIANKMRSLKKFRTLSHLLSIGTNKYIHTYIQKLV